MKVIVKNIETVSPFILGSVIKLASNWGEAATFGQLNAMRSLHAGKVIMSYWTRNKDSVTINFEEGQLLPKNKRLY